MVPLKWILSLYYHHLTHHCYYYLALPRPRVKLARDDIPPLPLPPGPPFTLGGGDLGRRASIRSVQPVVIWPDAKYPAYTSGSKLLLVSPGPSVSQPGRMVLSRPNTCSLSQNIHFMFARIHWINFLILYCAYVSRHRRKAD